jgi:hypothetical protein
MLLGITLAIHNIVRWIVLIALIFALYRAYSGWLGKKIWEATDRLSGLIFSIALDVQLLLGIILIFLRGFTMIQMRFYMEHIGPMLLAVIFTHIGSSQSKKADQDVDKHQRAAIWFTLTLLIILISIPWARPLLPSF